jgi:hypothetical protein
MRTSILAAVVGFGVLSATPLQVFAVPADGASIANIGRQIDPVVNIATKKKKRAQAQSQAKPSPCAADQTRSNRTGGCIPEKSQY